MLILTVIVALCIALLIYSIMVYNNLVSLKNNVSKNWSNIDVLLKQRYSELPKLIDTCQQYMQYERTTLEKVVEARKAALAATEGRDILALGQAEGILKDSLGKLFALAENYPDLKTNEAFHQLQTRISDLENMIADRRELYNDSANRNNIRIHQFPDVIIASLFKFSPFTLLKFSESEIQDVEVKNRFDNK
jgi:LemA protein